MANELFVDTSGLYALLVKTDQQHGAAVTALRAARGISRRCLTTDYVLDETTTLLKMRGHGHLVAPLLDATLDSQACRIIWMDPGRFDSTRRFLAKHNDQQYSFTDCFSFVVMSQCHLRDALTKDHHFRQAGFNPLLV